MDYCYILWNISRTHTYAGYTNNLTRRLRQHNKEICGGAKSTSKNGPWEFAFQITSNSELWDRKRALSFEYYLKAHGKKCMVKKSPIERRIDLLKQAIDHEKFNDIEVIIDIHPEILNLGFLNK